MQSMAGENDDTDSCFEYALCSSLFTVFVAVRQIVERCSKKQQYRTPWLTLEVQLHESLETSQLAC